MNCRSCAYRAELRERFRRTEYSHPDLAYQFKMIPRLKFSQLYVLQLGVAKELGLLMTPPF